MNLGRIGIALAALTLVAAVVTAAVWAHRSTRTRDRATPTRVGTLHYEAYLPVGYDRSGLRYPVVYFLHGLPADATTYQNAGWVERALDAARKQAILIVPQGARADDTDPEYLGKWEAAIATDLPKVVDARYRTIRSRAGRAIVGVSAGGYGAMHLALAHLSEFGAVESWSGYFHPTDPTGSVPLDLGSPQRNAAANVHRQLKRLEAQLDRTPLYIAFYIGRGDTYRQFVAENEQFNQELSAAGIPHVFRLYPGGHSQSLWASEAPAWLALALNHLAPAR